MEWKNLQAAAFYDNDAFIKEYLECYQASEQDKNTLTRVLHKAVESCSIKVVQTILNSPHGTSCCLCDVTEVVCSFLFNCTHV